jgi:polyhydroxyalkanoate synthesis repressor PhaR
VLCTINSLNISGFKGRGNYTAAVLTVKNLKRLESMTETEQTIRIIKKYPNRRVYDTHLSRYIKVDDLRDMIIDGIAFKVIDSKTKEDVTRSVLLQIVLEQESENTPLFSSENLMHFIRYYDHNHSVMFSAYLTQSLQFFNQQQDQPNQLLFSFLENNKCIGYGGLVHINWVNKNAEVSFIMQTEFEKERFEEIWAAFLLLLEEVAFLDLKLVKIFTYAFDLRPKLYPVLILAGFNEESRLSDHCFFEGKYIDVVIHSKINANC